MIRLKPLNTNLTKCKNVRSMQKATCASQCKSLHTIRCKTPSATPPSLSHTPPASAVKKFSPPILPTYHPFVFAQLQSNTAKKKATGRPESHRLKSPLIFKQRQLFPYYSWIGYWYWYVIISISIIIMSMIIMVIIIIQAS